MPSIAIGRQPIFDKELNTVAYELLFRDCDGQNRAKITNGDQATSEVILTAFTEIGLKNLFDNKPAFLNLTQSFLEGVFPLPNLVGQVVLEVLENIPVTEGTVAAVRKLSQQGYVIALDDHIYHPHLDPFVDAAQIIKLDVLAQDHETLADTVKLLRGKGKKLLAEKIETHVEYEFCQSLCFDYYQGYFFCRPEVLTLKAIPANKLQVLKILSKLQDPDISVSELEKEISHDVTLSYRLLRYINSAHFALRQEIESISQAIMLLGWDNIRSIATLIIMSRIEDKNIDLFKTGLVRARMCHLLAAKIKPGAEDMFFTAGLLSIIDALMDQPMQELMQRLPLSEELQNALVYQQGNIGHTLFNVIEYTRCKLSTVSGSDYSMDELTEAYLQAMQWADVVTIELTVAA